MSSAGKRALEYLQAIYPKSGRDLVPETQPWCTAVPGDHARETGMESGAVQVPVFDADDVIEFVDEFAGRRNVYHKAARFAAGAPGPQIMYAQAFFFSWLDIDLVPKPQVATQKYIDMVCDALDDLAHKPSVINATGGGVHALWHFDRPLIAGAGGGHILCEQINRELARVYSGDTAQCHPAGGLRLPYTVNMNRSVVVPAHGGPPAVKVLRLEPEHTHVPMALLDELAGFGTKLSKTKDGSWARVSAVLSKVERAHMIEARNGAMLDGDAKPAKTSDDWSEIARAMVLKGGRKIAAAQYAGWLIRKGVPEDEAVADMLALSTEAAHEVRAGGGAPMMLSRGTLTAIFRSITKTAERRHAS